MDLSIMASRISVFEMVLLIVDIAAAVLGFQLINQVYSMENGVSWFMIIAIFSWLTLLVLFISLSLVVDVSKKQLEEIRRIIVILEKKRK
ncbi:hypothetical protein HYU50_01055 [Candidatus Woesearchaeota archaeon]|nr:hypothetical protein [Candidatus Woesearchaeota archaeon]